VFTFTADCGQNGRRSVYSYSNLWAELYDECLELEQTVGITVEGAFTVTAER